MAWSDTARRAAAVARKKSFRVGATHSPSAKEAVDAGKWKTTKKVTALRKGYKTYRDVESVGQQRGSAYKTGAYPYLQLQNRALG